MKKCLLCLLSVLLLFSAAGCAARSPVDPEAMISAAEELGLTVTEMEAADLEGSGLTANIGASNDNVNCQLLVFSDESTAQSAYAQFLSMIQSNGGTDPVKQVNTSTYSKYFLEEEGLYTALVRINNSVFYGEDTGEDGILKSLVEKIGYN